MCIQNALKSCEIEIAPNFLSDSIRTAALMAYGSNRPWTRPLRTEPLYLPRIEFKVHFHQLPGVGYVWEAAKRRRSLKTYRFIKQNGKCKSQPNVSPILLDRRTVYSTTDVKHCSVSAWVYFGSCGPSWRSDGKCVLGVVLFGAWNSTGRSNAQW